MRTSRVGAAVIAAVGLLAGAQPVQRWVLVQDLRVGAADGPIPYAFSVQPLVVANRHGTLYVLDRGNHEVRVFDSRGRHVRTFGGEGAGPGEFLDPSNAGWVADTLWVSDAMQTRTTFFSPNGAVLRTTGAVTRASARYTPAVPEAVLADGSYLVLARPVQPRSAAADTDVRRLPVLRVGKSGPPDTLAWRDLGNRRLRINVGQRRIFVMQPWDDSPLVTASTSGQSVVLVARPAASRRENARFRVTRISPSGDTLFSQSFTYNPVRVPSGWASRWADETGRSMAAERPGTAPGAFSAALARAAYVPAFMPPITAVVAGDDGTVWLRREEQGSTVEWIVLGAEGRLLAEVRGPSGLEIQQVQRSHVWGVMTDDMDVPYVHRFRIQRPGPR